MKIRLLWSLIHTLVLGIHLVAQSPSSIVYEDAEGCLRYVADQEGNYIADFSMAGYRNGEVPLPVIPVVMTIGPVTGDNTAHLQTALDQVGAMPPDANGFRGALLLEPGIYDVSGTVTIRESGVVLRGSGNGEDPLTNTIIRGIGNTPNQRDLLRIGNGSGANWETAVPGSYALITNTWLPAGSRSVQVNNPDKFKIGDPVVVFQASTQEWLASINFGSTHGDDPWAPGEIDLFYYRTIVAIDSQENKITLDAPIFDHLDPALSSAFLYHPIRTGIREKMGVENLRIDIQTAGEFDLEHAKNAIRLLGVEDCWVKDVTALHFSYAAIDMATATRVTVRDCQGLAPHSPIDGGWRYNFAVGAKSNLILFENCRATQGRHSFVSNGTSSVSGIVFYNCTTSNDHASSEGHRRWSQGMLFDNINFTNPNTVNLLGLYNRGSYGTGHGWSATNSVAWRVTMPAGYRIILQQPPNRQNYAIGCQAIVSNASQFLHPPGFQELTNDSLAISSLYAAQLAHRLAYGVTPDAPARLKATFSEEIIHLEWLDIAADETQYQIELSTDGGQTYSPLSTLPADATTFEHTPPPGSTLADLRYRVVARGVSCPSAYSNPAAVTLVNSIQDPLRDSPIHVFPNPAQAELFIQTPLEITAITLYDYSGKRLNSYGPTRVLASDWPQGIYLIKFNTKGGSVHWQRIVKQ
ncbi:MAG: T9SS type A sorting domain-containing protein [Lewinellaceae bacterium]|nr:T9SS type A sorting domain-containing protein [Lewinellaceae bacterium]